MSGDASPRLAVVVFPGTWSERDFVHVAGLLGWRARTVWHTETELGDADAVVLPGGFAHGDHLRTGAIARFSPVMAAVGEFADRGGPVIGSCNGFQILCEAGLLPGALRPNASLSFVCRDVGLVIEREDTPFTSRCERGQYLTIPVKHGDGCWHPAPDSHAGHVVLRYAAGENPNGSLEDVAGVVNEQGNVMGLMPHPEHAVQELIGSTDGALILGSLIDAAHRPALVPA